MGYCMSVIDFMLSVRQQKILAPLLLNPEQSFGTTELIEKSGEGRGAGQAALRKMVESGVVIVTHQGNQKRIQINTEFPIYPELRSICLKTFGLLWTIKGILEPLEIERAFIFGSVAKGSDKADSDIDLMVISDIDLVRVYAAVDAIEKAVGRTVHINKHARDEWASLQSDPLIQRIMTEPRIEVFP